MRYLKDNRLIPHGFDKKSAGQDIAVIGSAARTRASQMRAINSYKVALGAAQGPFHIEVELWYQPIGYRWANNLKAYAAAEPRRFTNYFDAMSNGAELSSRARRLIGPEHSTAECGPWRPR